MNLILRHSNEYAYQNKRSISAREYPITYPRGDIQNSIIGISQFGGLSLYSSLIPT